MVRCRVRLRCSRYYSPIYKRQGNRNHQDQGLPEIHARHQNQAQNHAQYRQEISCWQMKHGIRAFGLLAAQDR